MTQAIVTYLNAVIDTVGRVDERYCMAELRSDGTTTVPYTYVGNGKVKPISIDGGSLSYWRISGAVPPMEQIASQYGKPRLSATYPLRLVIIARRKDSTVDDGFMPTRLAEDIANALTGSHPDLKTLLKANTVSVSAGYDVNITSVWSDEFKGTGVNDPNYTRTIMALSVSVTVIGDRACWENECDYDPDILHLFDFCQAGTVARLTDEQVTCLEAALCDPCADATVTVNTSPFGTAPSGGGLNVPVVNGGSNPVGSIVAGEVVIANNSTFINGTQVTDQEAEIDANIFVTLDGTQSGTWNAGTQTWEVTGAACAAANLEINGVQQETIASGGTFNLIATLDGVAGGSYNPATDTLSFTSNTGWQRPSFWPVLPTLTAASEAMYVLYPVYENRLNQYTLSTNSGRALIDWGDGTSVASNGLAQTKVYDYAGIAGTVFVDSMTGENYKFIQIGVTRTGLPITFLYVAIAPVSGAQRVTSFELEYNISLPNATELFIGGTNTREPRFVNILRIWALGTVTSLRLYNFTALEQLQVPAIISGSWVSAFSNMGSPEVGDINYGTATGISGAFTGARIKSHGNLTANSVSLFNSYVLNNFSITSFGTVNSTSCTSIASMFDGASALMYIGLLTIPSCTNYSNAFSNCQSLTEIRFHNAAACTNTSGMIANNYSLQVLHMPNLTRGVNFTNSSIGNYGMNIFASGDGILNGVGTAAGAQTITVTGTPFGALLTALDATALAIRLVMTGKGYAVAN